MFAKRDVGHVSVANGPMIATSFEGLTPQIESTGESCRGVKAKLASKKKIE
jgi:hypothetical protein